MFQRDYLMRQFEQLGQVLAKVMGFKERGDYKSAMEIIEESSQKMLQEQLDFFEELPDENFTEAILEKGTENLEYLHIAAELLFQKADIQLKENNEEKAISNLKKSLMLFEYVQMNDTTYSLDRDFKMETIKKILGL